MGPISSGRLQRDWLPIFGRCKHGYFCLRFSHSPLKSHGATSFALCLIHEQDLAILTNQRSANILQIFKALHNPAAD